MKKNSLRIWLIAAVISLGSFSPIAASIPILQQLNPTSTSYLFDTDFTYMSWSSVADVTAQVTAVDLHLGLGNSSSSGCESGDFLGFTSGHIALIQRGSCLFSVKAENAAIAGAVGVLIFNQGNTIDRTNLLAATLTNAYIGGIPVLGLSYGLGEALAGTSGLQVRMSVDQSLRPVPPTIPEPGSIFLLATGIAGLIFSRRKKK